MSKVTVVSRPNRITIASKGVQGPPGDATPELLEARDTAVQAAIDAAGHADSAQDASDEALGAASAASGSASAAAASANLAEQARLLGATIGFATKADMDASLAHPDGTLALVTSDPTPANNGTYRKTGASGSGSWVKSADRVTGLEGRVSGLEGKVDSAQIVPLSPTGINFDLSAPALVISGIVYSRWPNGVRLVAAGTYPIPSANGSFWAELNPADGTISFRSTASSTRDSALKVLFGFRIAGQSLNVYGLDNYAVNGAEVERNHDEDRGDFFATTGGIVNFDTVANEITFPAGRVLHRRGYYVISAVTIPNSAGNLGRLFYNIASGDISAVRATTTSIPNGSIQIGLFDIPRRVFHLAAAVSVDGAQDNNEPRSGRLISEPQYINFDWVGGFLRITEANRVRVHYGAVNVFVPMQDMALPSPNAGIWHRLLYTPETGALSWLAASSQALPATAVTVGYFHPIRKEVFGVHDYYTNGQPVAGEGHKIVERIEWIPVMGDTRPDFEIATPLPNFKALGATADHTEFYALYDALVADHPDYASRTLLGEDDAGNSIYRYDFAPPAVPTAGRHAKMILMSGVHGPERAGIFCLYSAIKHICESWQSNPLLETLRWNCHFIVVPIAVPYGFDNGTRTNENGVDVARNFPADWESASNDPGSIQYRGPSPLSEKSAQYLDAIMSANRDAIYCGSFHNFGDPGANNNFIWNSSTTTFGVRLAQGLISTLTRRWKTRFAWLPQNNIWYAGYADLTSPPGSEGRQPTLAYGIQGGTFEVCASLPLAPDSDAYSSEVATLGTETVVNWLLMNLEHGTQLYNGRGS